MRSLSSKDRAPSGRQVKLVVPIVPRALRIVAFLNNGAPPVVPGPGGPGGREGSGARGRRIEAAPARWGSRQRKRAGRRARRRVRRRGRQREPGRRASAG